MNRKRMALGGVLAALGLAMVLLLLISSPTPAARAAELTVCTAGPPDCGYSSVQDAVFAARDGDLIKIAGGVYTGVWNWLGTNTTYLTATQMVVITQSLTLRGGYTVTNWTTPDPEANPTTLDAQGQGRVFLISGKIDPNIAPTIEGLRITGGNSDELGGQLYGEPWNLVADVGGGVYAVTATLTISNCEIANNVAAYDGDYPYVNRGGAIYVNSALNLINSRITGNTGDCTAGVYLDDVGYANIVSNEFGHNLSTGGNCYTGGGLYARGSDVSVRHNVFRDNSAYGGGGLTATGGAIVEGNLLEGNRAIYGGGIQIRDGAVTLNGNTVIGNNAQQAGGGISAFNGRPRALLVNNLIAGNTVSTWDGRPCGGLDGGSAVLAFADSVLTLTHNTIARNRFPTCADNAILVSGATVTLTNNIVVSHGLGITVTAGATATLDGTLWGSGDWANGTDWAGDGTILTGTTNIWGDPGFVDADAGDYHIGLASAARDAGVEASVPDDLDGDPRPQGAGYDIGADEFAFCDNVSEIPKAECEALVAFYNSTDGPHWRENTGWLQTNTPCGWHGVDCSGGHVFQFWLPYNNLSGSIPPEMGNLSNLRLIFLEYNQLSGSIPPELGNLNGLVYVRLQDNQLSGEIPPGLGSLPNLEDLWLHNNRLSGEIPPELGNLVGIWSLLVSNNRLSGDIPPDLCNLSNEYLLLDLGYNMLTASDPAVLTCLGEKDGDWAHTQTVAPEGLEIAGVSGASVELSWEPIAYTGDGGYYEVSYATASGGPYTVHGTTADKTAGSYLADNLSPYTTHYFVVRTYTPAHGDQQNALWSGYSEEVSATTTVDLGSLSFTVDLQGRSDDSSTLFTAWTGEEEAGNCTSSSDGLCTITALPVGVYSVTAEMASYLDSVREGVTVNVGETTNLPLVELPGGDTNDDCVLNIQDLAFMGYRFNACEGDPLFDVRGDVNADGCINILDLAMAGGNFNQACPVPW